MVSSAKTWCILVLGGVLFPTIFMKELAELKIVSLSLFAAALVFVVMNIGTFLVRGKFPEPNPDMSYMTP